MKRNITPFYIDGPVESVDCSSGSQTISGKSSFVLVTGPSSGNPVTLSLPVRTSDDRPIVPGTMVTMVRTDSDAVAVTVTSESALDTNSSSTLSAYLDSTSFMFVGPNNDNIFGSWTLISSDLAAADWDGGSVNGDTDFFGAVYLRGSTKIGDNPADDLQIASNFRFSDSSNNPTIASNTAGSGTASLNESAHPNAAIITFTAGWANGDTAVITLPTDVAFEAERFILKNQAADINGDIEVTGNSEITFTATGECEGDLGYLVIVMGS